jgi:hypothetical protein
VLKKIQHDLHHGSQSCDFGPNCFKVAGKPASPIRLASERASLTRNFEKLFAKLTANRAMSNAKGFIFRYPKCLNAANMMPLAAMTKVTNFQV